MSFKKYSSLNLLVIMSLVACGSYNSDNSDDGLGEPSPPSISETPSIIKIGTSGTYVKINARCRALPNPFEIEICPSKSSIFLDLEKCWKGLIQNNKIT